MCPRCLVLLYLFCWLCSSMVLHEPARAQPLATIDRIADISGHKPVLIRGLTNRCRVKEGASMSWKDAAPNTSLLSDSRLKLLEYIRVDVLFNRFDLQGNIYLAPDSLLAGSRQAEYHLKASPQGGVEFRLVSGSAVVNWLRGLIDAITGDTRIHFNGTRVAIFARDADYGLVYLDEGEITFPQYRNVLLRAGEAAILRRGQPPQKIALTLSQLKETKDFIKYNRKTVWHKAGRKWYKKPKYIMGAVAGSAAVGYLVWRLFFNDGDRQLPGPPGLP